MIHFSPTVGQAVLTGSRRRVPADSRIRAQQNSFNRQQAVEDKRTRPPLRTRVRNPNLPGIRNRHCYLGSYTDVNNN